MAGICRLHIRAQVPGTVLPPVLEEQEILITDGPTPVAPGTADRSYGIHVAKLAGLPEGVTTRAAEVLEILEKGEEGGALARLADDLPLFRAARPPAPAPHTSPAEDLLKQIRPDELSPREALELLYRLRGMLEE